MSRRYFIAFGSMAFAQIGTTLIQLAFSIYTTRFFEPKDFGAYAVALSLLSLIGIFSQLGLGNAVSRIDVTRKSEISAIFWFSTIVGLFGTILTIILATTWSTSWSLEGSKILIILLAPIIFISVTTNVLIGITIKRELFESLSVIRLFSALLSAITSYIVIKNLHSYTTLATYPLVFNSILLLALIILNLNFLKLRIETYNLRPNLKFAILTFRTSLARYIIFILPTYMISKIFGAIILGNWNRAVTFFQVPVEQVTGALRNILYPKYAALNHSPKQLMTNVENILMTFSVYLTPLSLFSAAFVDDLIREMFPLRWQFLPEMSQYFCLSIAIVTLSNITETILETADRQSICVRSVIFGGFSILISCTTSYIFGSWHILGLIPLTSAACIHFSQIFLCKQELGFEAMPLLRTYAFSILHSSLIMVLIFEIKKNLTFDIKTFAFFAIAIYIIYIYFLKLRQFSLKSIFEISD